MLLPPCKNTPAAPTRALLRYFGGKWAIAPWVLDQLRAVQGMVALAGYPSTLYDSLLADWQRIERPHRAQDSTRPRTEVLWLSPNTIKNRAERT